MTTRAFQKIYTKIDNITKATVTLRAQGVGNDELATVGGKLAQLKAVVFTDAAKGGYTCYRLADLADALGVTVK